MSEEQQALLPAETLLRLCRCNSLLVGANACPHCGAGWAEGRTPVTKYIRADPDPVAQPAIADIDVTPRVCLKCEHEERFSDNEGGVCEKHVDMAGHLCGCYCEFASVQPPQQAEAVAREIVHEWAEHDMNQSYGDAYLSDMGVDHLEERIASALATAESRGADRQREADNDRAEELIRQHITDWDSQDCVGEALIAAIRKQQ